MGDTLVAIHRNEVCTTRIKRKNVINAATYAVMDFGWVVISLTSILYMENSGRHNLLLLA